MAGLFPYPRAGNPCLAFLFNLAGQHELIYKIVILTFVEEIFVRTTCARRVPFRDYRPVGHHLSVCRAKRGISCVLSVLVSCGVPLLGGYTHE